MGKRREENLLAVDGDALEEAMAWRDLQAEVHHHQVEDARERGEQPPPPPGQPRQDSVAELVELYAEDPEQFEIEWKRQTGE